MDPQTKHNLKRMGVRVAEEVEIELELHGKDKDEFKANPTAYVKAAIESAGFKIRELRIPDLAQKAKEGVERGRPIIFRYAAYHIVWDRDPIAICMWTPGF